MIPRTSRSISLTGALVLALSACGGDAEPAAPSASVSEEASAPAEATESATPDVPESESETELGAEAEVEGEALGTVTVDGVLYDIDTLRNCEPLEDGPFDTELELQGRGTVSDGAGYDGGDWVQIDVYVRSMSGTSMNEVSWAGPEGVFGGGDAPTITLTEGTVTGSATPVDALTQSESIEVTFDLPVPDELINCHG